MVSGSAAAGSHRATILVGQELQRRSLVAAARPLLRAARRGCLAAIGLARASCCGTSAWGSQPATPAAFLAYLVSSITYMSVGSRLAHLDRALVRQRADKSGRTPLRERARGGVNTDYIRCE